MPPHARSLARRRPAIEPALGLLELDSIAAGIAAGDAMAKRAPIDVIRAGTVHPGKYLVLVGGAVADVEEALEAGREVGASSVLDVRLPPERPPGASSPAMRGARRAAAGEALGIIETATVAAIIEAADAGLKGARVAPPGAPPRRRPGRQGLPPVRRGRSPTWRRPWRSAAARIAGLAGRRPSASSPSSTPRWRENLAADARFAARVRE